MYALAKEVTSSTSVVEYLFRFVITGVEVMFCSMMATLYSSH